MIVAHYKDQATAFNGVKKEQIVGKGVLNNQISSFIFEKLNAAGVASILLKRFQIQINSTKSKDYSIRSSASELYSRIFL